MLARILAIGDELLLGRTVDTNSSHIARWLTDRGFRVDRATVVGDGQGDIEAALQVATAGADFVAITGGLGPTDDDRTRHALAAVMGVRLAESATAWERIQAWYQRNRPSRPIPVSNRRQALMPVGAQIIENDRGTAPGMLASIGACRVVCMPGVPHEMFAMLASLEVRVGAWFPRLAPPVISEVWFTGIGESAAQELIGNLLTEANPQVGITVNELGHLTLRVVGAAKQVTARVAALKQAVKPYALPAAGVAPSLVAWLGRRGLTIATAESCTCGHVVAQLGAVPGASHVLREALIAYHAEVKTARLRVSPTLIARHGVVSEAVAAAMATGMRRRSGADLVVATTGIAGPDGGSKSQPVGTVCIAVADHHGVTTRTTCIAGSRDRVQRRAAAQALVLAWEVASGRATTV